MRVATWMQDSPLGPVSVTTSATGLRVLDIAPDPAAVEGDDHPVDEVAEALAAYFEGDFAAVDRVPVDLRGRSPFSRAVLNALRSVPAGSLTSYGRLAIAAGRRGAARAVGGAMGANPVPIVVPCHRVVAGDGSLGGFSCGLDVKGWLLAHEGHAVASMERGKLYAVATGGLSRSVPLRSGIATPSRRT